MNLDDEEGMSESQMQKYANMANKKKEDPFASENYTTDYNGRPIQIERPSGLRPLTPPGDGMEFTVSKETDVKKLEIPGIKRKPKPLPKQESVKSILEIKPEDNPVEKPVNKPA